MRLRRPSANEVPGEGRSGGLSTELRLTTENVTRFGACPACLRPAAPASVPGSALRPCPACGALFVADPPSEADLAAYYNSAYAVEPADVGVRRTALWSALLTFAEQHIARGRAVEVGASSGHLLRLLETRGWRAAGVELDARAREQHARRSPTIPMYADLDDARTGGWDALELIVALHTIEHMREPRAFLKAASDMLREGGILMITTPNGGSIVRWLAGPQWEWWTPPAHLALFTPAGLLLALRDSGFEALEVRTRRGDANGTASNVLLGPLRALKRRVRGTARQVISERSAGRRLSGLIDALFDPVFMPLRKRAYQALLGPELIVVARRLPRARITNV